MSTVARAHEKRKRQERLPLCDRLSWSHHCMHLMQLLSTTPTPTHHPLCLTLHPEWMTDRCLLHVHDSKQPFLT